MGGGGRRVESQGDVRVMREKKGRDRGLLRDLEGQGKHWVSHKRWRAGVQTVEDTCMRFIGFKGIRTWH